MKSCSVIAALLMAFIFGCGAGTEEPAAKAPNQQKAPAPRQKADAPETEGKQPVAPKAGQSTVRNVEASQKTDQGHDFLQLLQKDMEANAEHLKRLPRNDADLDEFIAKGRRIAWELVRQQVSALRSRVSDAFPGIRDWCQEFATATKTLDTERPLEEWPEIDYEKLVSHNPLFWRAYYEVVPADGGMMSIHAMLLAATGRFEVANKILMIAEQNPRNTPEVLAMLDQQRQLCRVVLNPAASRIKAGTVHFDADRCDQAIRVFRDVIKSWPECGWAHYELGLSYYAADCEAAGTRLPKRSVITDVKSLPPFRQRTLDEYALARKFDPLLHQAYQGTDPERLRSLQLLVRFVNPALETMKAGKIRDPKQMMMFAAVCQEIGFHEFALPAGQVVVAFRDRFDPKDHPFIEKNLNALVPGSISDKTLARLAAKQAQFVQLVPMKRAAPTTASPTYVRQQIGLVVTVEELFKVVEPDDVNSFVDQVEPQVAELFAILQSDAALTVQFKFDPVVLTEVDATLQVTRQSDNKLDAVNDLRRELKKLKPPAFPSKWQLIIQYASGRFNKVKKSAVSRKKPRPQRKPPLDKVQMLADLADSAVLFNSGKVTFSEDKPGYGHGPWLLLAPSN